MSLRTVGVALLLVLFPCLAVAGFTDPAPESGSVRVRADKLSHEQEKDLIHAEGNVEVDWGSSTLFADKVDYFQGEERVEASSRVKIVKDGDRLTGDKARVNLGTRQGVVENGYLFLQKPNLHLRGAVIEKTGEADYALRKGTITSCDGENPGWQFGIDDLTVTMDDFATGRNAFFYLGDTPVFWFPYILYPVKVERQSGFLFPKLGNSGKKGAFIDIPYYWAMAPSSDATIDLDLQSKRGVGLGVEYRYLSSNKGFGNNNGYLIYDTQQDRFRGDLGVKQQANFTDATYWRADLNMTLDRDFYRDYRSLNGEYNRQYLGATAFLSHKREELLATFGADYLDNLDGPNNRATLQRVPFLTLAGTGRQLGSLPLYFGFEGNLTHFERDEGGRGERLLLAPELRYSRSLHEGVYATVRAGYRQRFYHGTDDPATDGWYGKGLLNGDAALRTELARTYDVSWGELDRVRHQIAPELRYEVREQQDQSSLPFFDYDDREVGGEILSVAIRNNLAGRTVRSGVTEYRNLLNLLLSQGYQLSGSRRDLLVLVDEGRKFTDTRLRMDLTPLPRFSFFGDLRVSPYSGTLTNAALGLDMGQEKGNLLGFSWHRAYDKLDYLEARVALAELKPFTLSAAGRYSFDRPGFLESVYSVEYKHQCWGLVLAYHDRPDNKEVTFNFTLAGLGQSGPLRAF